MNCLEAAAMPAPAPTMGANGELRPDAGNRLSAAARSATIDSPALWKSRSASRPTQRNRAADRTVNAFKK
jgi:hypothetical protein